MLHGHPLNSQILFPDHAQEERAGAVHHGDVWHEPIPVVASEGIDHGVEEWVLGDRTHCVVGDACGNGASHPGWVGE